nr:hypothetical protein [Tanacetum cinerariifolium]
MNQQLKEMFQANASKEHLDVVKSRMACKPKPGASIFAFVLEMKGYLDILKFLNMMKETLMMELYSVLQTAEQGIENIDAPSTLIALMLIVGHNAKKERLLIPTGKERPQKESLIVGLREWLNLRLHLQAIQRKQCASTATQNWKRSYPKYLKDLKDEKVKKDSYSCMFMIELYNTTTLESWVLDIGYGTHICTVLQGLKKSKSLKHGELKLSHGKQENHACDKDWKIKHKSGTFEVFKRYQNEVENQLDRKIKLPPPRTPELNGVAERKNRTLLDMVRSMMSRAKLPISFWGYALETVTHILNLVPTKKVSKTPFEMWKRKQVVTPVKRDDISLPIHKTSGSVSKPPQFYYGVHIKEDKISNSTLTELDEPANHKEVLVASE